MEKRLSACFAFGLLVTSSAYAKQTEVTLRGVDSGGTIRVSFDDSAPPWMTGAGVASGNNFLSGAPGAIQLLTQSNYYQSLAQLSYGINSSSQTFFDNVHLQYQTFDRNTGIWSSPVFDVAQVTFDWGYSGGWSLDFGLPSSSFGTNEFYSLEGWGATYFLSQMQQGTTFGFNTSWAIGGDQRYTVQLESGGECAGPSFGAGDDCYTAVWEAIGTEISANQKRFNSHIEEQMRIESIWVDGQILTPVPEPESYAMMLAGLGLLGVFARRRKQKLNT